MLRLNHLRLRVFTASRRFGADIPLKAGLNVIYAGNSSGKSTSLQAIVYALGLERSLGPQLEIPLPYAMRERIHDRPDAEYEPVIESYVEIEIQNSAQQFLTVRRDVVGGADKKLIRTWADARLSKNLNSGKQRDFFVHDAGSAQREDGFHHYLSDFIGWNLPNVSRFDGADGPLYLEAIFPMLFVEQKRGWSTIQGPFPTFLRIQDVARRVIEFLLDLEAASIRRQRAELRRQLSSVQQRWEGALYRIQGNNYRIVRTRGIPDAPTAELAQGKGIKTEVLYEEEWLSIANVIEKLRDEINVLEQQEIVSAEQAAPDLIERSKNVAERIDHLAAAIDTARIEFSSQIEERNALRLRLNALRIDLKRNQDALKLKKLGSALGRAASDCVCPVCHQEVESELLPTITSAGMGLEENIVFVRSQIELYEASERDGGGRLNELQARYNALADELSERQGELRGIRQSLVQPSESPSRAKIEAIIRKQSFFDRLRSTQQAVDGLVDELRSLATEWVSLQNKLKLLSSEDLTDRDLDKMKKLEMSVQSHLVSYGFKSFRPNEIHLSKDNLRPLIYTTVGSEIVEKEINFEISASDAIRLKWAYYLSLRAVSANTDANHCGLVVFDEPGQQEMEASSLYALLNSACENSRDDQQLILATSEPIDSLKAALSGRGHLVSFSGLILQPLQ